MTQSNDEARALLIKKLLNKAEAKGVTDAERDTFNAKATELMIKWGIEEAMLVDADRVATEKIVKVEFVTDCPKSYSYEYAALGIRLAEVLGCQGLFQKKHDGRTAVLVVGFEHDVERLGQLYTSLSLQCTYALTTWFTRQDWYGLSGSAKFNGKRSFIVGFGRGVKDKLTEVYRTTVASAAPGTDLVLVDRRVAVSKWIDENMAIGMARGRSYGVSAAAAGSDAGRRANVGQKAVR